MMEAQEAIDAFYWSNGPCCAGCDRWASLNTHAGECTLSAPMAGSDRASMLGINGSSLPIGAGHAFTPRAHVCGQFVDAFDWSTLPLMYRKRIGCTLSPRPAVGAQTKED